MSLRIESMYAFVTVDPDDDTEGIIGFSSPDGQWLPMVGADMERVEQLRPIATSIARQTGREVRVVHFTERVEVEVL